MAKRDRVGRLGWAGVAAALVVVAVLAMRDGGEVVTPPAEPGSGGGAAAGAREDRQASPAATAAAPAPARPLPPVGTPFRHAIDELQRRARAGEPAAMCRLAAEHTECKRIRGMLDATSRLLEMQQTGVMTVEFEDDEDRARHVRRLARNSDRLIEESRHCDGVPEIGQRELVHQWRAAALAGSRPAMEYYATGQAFPRDQWLSLLPELATYKAEAGTLARRLAQEGSTGALLMLGMAYMPDRAGGIQVLDQVLEPDAVEALALLRMAQAGARAPAGPSPIEDFLGKHIARLEARMTPQQLGAVAARIAELEVARRGAPAYADNLGREQLVDACAAS